MKVLSRKLSKKKLLAIAFATTFLSINLFGYAEHELLVKADPQLWQENVGSFLDKLR